MIDLLLTILIMSLVCCGAHVVINDDFIPHWFFLNDKQWERKLKVAIFKPLFTCARCMASLWGGATYWLLHGFDLNIIPAIIATAFLNSVFINYYYSKT